jgi:hypothetical protein
MLTGLQQLDLIGCSSLQQVYLGGCSSLKTLRGGVFSSSQPRTALYLRVYFVAFLS